MTTMATVALIVIAGFVWGGFLGFLFRALRRERVKRSSAPRKGR
jgi:hypothetical protein